MKKIIMIFLILGIIFCHSAISEEYATPTDLLPIIEEISNEIEEELIEDPIEEELIEETPSEEDILALVEELYPNHHIEIRIIQQAYCIGDEVILGFELIDYPPGYITHIEWQHSLDNIEWTTIENENEETLKFIVDEENNGTWYRVMVTYHFDLNI